MILLQLQTILLPDKKSVTEKRTKTKTFLNKNALFSTNFFLSPLLYLLLSVGEALLLFFFSNLAYSF